PEQSPVEHVRRLMPGAPEAKVRARVSQMGLATEKMATAAKDLSGGEKARLLMGLAAFDVASSVSCGFSSFFLPDVTMSSRYSSISPSKVVT
ncbi:hypothetical protein ACC672_36955, partial [Rhizobium ruizarguesonis]